MTVYIYIYISIVEWPTTTTTVELKLRRHRINFNGSVTNKNGLSCAVCSYVCVCDHTFWNGEMLRKTYRYNLSDIFDNITKTPYRVAKQFGLDAAALIEMMEVSQNLSKDVLRCEIILLRVDIFILSFNI